VDQIAERLLERWKQIPDCQLRLEPMALYVEDEEVLSAQEDEGHWLLPAFMAGVKTIRLSEEVLPPDLVRLATELGALGPSLSSISHLRDWLWSEGAEGFEILLDHGFVDGLDASMTDPVRQREVLEAMRVQASVALGAQAQRIASRDLDAAAARDEFLAPLDAFAEAIDGGLLALAAEQAESLAGACDDPAFWIDAQVHLALAHPELQSHIPPERLARRVLSLVRRGASGRFMNFLAELKRKRDPYARRLLEALETEEAGDVLGRHVAMDERFIGSLSSLLAGPASPLSRTLANRLLERCTCGQEDLRWLARLMATAGFEVFWGKVDPSVLTERCAIVVCRLLVAGKASLPLVADLFTRVAPALAVRLAGLIPGDTLLRLKQPVLDLLSRASFKDAEALLAILAKHPQHGWGAILGEALVTTRMAEWPLPLVRSAFKVIVGQGHAARYLVPLVQDRHFGDDVKLTALRFIENDAEAMAKLGSASLSELLFSHEVRERLRQLRRKLEEPS